MTINDLIEELEEILKKLERLKKIYGDLDIYE